MKNIKKPTLDIIKELTEDIPGWCQEEQLLVMYLLAETTNELDGEFLEIGSWCGRSAVILASAAKRIGTKLNCVDLFPNKEDWFKNSDGTYSFKVKVDNNEYFGCVSQKVWKEPFEKEILSMYNKHQVGTKEIFDNNMKKNNLTQYVQAFKGNSEEFINNFSGKIKLAFIDGDHGYEAVCKDIEAVEKFLVKGGWIIFDDAFTVNKGVDKAIDEMIINSNKYELCHQVTRKCFIAKKKS